MAGRQKGSRVRAIASIILNLGTRWKGVVSFPHRPHSSWGKKSPEYPLNWTLDRYPRSGGFEEEKDLFFPVGILNLDLPGHSPVAKMNSPSRIRIITIIIIIIIICLLCFIRNFRNTLFESV
jgi:hypothetical protein